MQNPLELTIEKFLDVTEMLPGDVAFGLIQVIIMAAECHNYHETLIEATDLPFEMQPDVLQELENTIFQAYENLLLFCGVAAQGFASAPYKLNIDMKEYIERLLRARKELLGIITKLDQHRHLPLLFQTEENLRLAVKVYEYIQPTAFVKASVNHSLIHVLMV